MSLDQPPANKMMTAPAAKKALQGFHFAATAEYYAEYIEAATIEEAEVIYQKVRRLINQPLSTVPESNGDVT